MDWGFIGILLAIIFFVTTIITTLIIAIKFTKKKQPVWAHKTTKIIGLGTNPPPELQVTFSGNPVNDVYQTTFLFFNNGNEAIRKDDIAEKVTLYLMGAKILREPVIKTKSNDAIKPSIRQVLKDNENCVELDFLYLDHKDGLVVEIIHTESQEITCNVNIIGARKLKNFGELKQYRSYIPGIILSMCIFFAMILVVYFVTDSIPALKAKWQPYLDEHSIIKYLISIGIPLLGGASIGFLSATLPEYFKTHKFPSWSSVEE